MTQKQVKYEILLSLLAEESHGRRIAKKIGSSLLKTQSSLKELREDNIIDYKVEGKNHIYFIKKNLRSRKMILNAENYRLLRLLDNYPYLEPVFQDMVKRCNGPILLFGSYAKGTETKNSDIDIFITEDDMKLKDEVEGLYENIHVKAGKMNPDNPLMKEIMKNHVIIKGGERFYEGARFFD